MERPILGITMGDPFGNGPEITVKALMSKGLYDQCRPVVNRRPTGNEVCG